MKIRRSLAATLAMYLLASTAQAGNLFCTGTVERVLMYADGRVMILSSWRADYTDICNAQVAWGGISETICLAWYGAALKAKKDRTTVTMYYPEVGSAVCATLPTYGSAPVPGSLMLE